MASASSQRVCQSCYEEVTVSVPSRFRETRLSSMERIFIDQGRLSVPGATREASSQLSDLAEYIFPPFFLFFLRPYLYECSCPVCSQNLAELGPASAQEAHVKNCLDGGSGISPQTSKYLVYKLPGESALIGTECMRYLSVISETI